MTLPTRRTRIVSLSASIVLVCLISGCANPPLYNQSRDKQGQDAKAAVAEVDLVAAVDMLQAKFKSLAELEALTQRERSILSRDLVIVELAKPPNKFRPESSIQERYVARLLDKRLQALGGAGADKEEVDELRRQAASKLRVLSAKSNTPIETCDAAAGEKASGARFGKLPAVQKMVATALLNDAVAFCQKVSAATAGAPGPGEILSLRQDLKREEDRIARHRLLLNNKRDLLDKAAAQAVQDAVGETPSERLQSAASKLEKLLAGIQSVADLAEAKALKAAEAATRLEALDKVLKALSTGETNLDKLDDGEKKAVLVVRFIPSLAGEVEVWMRERNRIRLAPLILAKENQRLALAGFEAELEVLQRRAQIQARILASAEAEALALVKAKNAVSLGATKLATPLNDMLDKGAAADRFRLYTSLTHLDEAEEHRLAAELGRLELDASAADLAIVASRSAATQWRNLAISIAAVLGDYHAQGVKPADLVEFFKAVGVIGIAAK